jgi:hypothetical protein
MEKALWEILVPTEKRDGTGFYRTRYHKVWDTKIRELAGGLTILSPASSRILVSHTLWYLVL